MKSKTKFVRYVKCIIIGLFTGAANGLFGSGGGTIAVPAMVLLLDEEEHKAHSTAIAIIFPLTLLSAWFYIKGNFIDYKLALKVIPGGIIGGYIGARLLKKCSSNLLRKIFAVFMVVAAARMIMSKGG